MLCLCLTPTRKTTLVPVKSILASDGLEKQRKYRGFIGMNYQGGEVLMIITHLTIAVLFLTTVGATNLSRIKMTYAINA